ncbi:MAG: hypothetical protein NC453_15275 [Muribaculum sp.]|nr:hypothetical protein [Muribaculum sp.]
MQLRKLLPTRLKHTILKSLWWMPDRIFLSLIYLAIVKRWPNLSHPKRFTEYIQVYKMKCRIPDMMRCVDKYEVRNYIKELMLTNYKLPSTTSPFGGIGVGGG